MGDLLIEQGVTRRSIERTLINFKKLGRDNITAAKVRSRIASLQESWTRFQDAHVQLLRSTPEQDLQKLDYFRNQEFEATEEAYQTTRDALTDFLEEMEPVVSQPSVFNSTGIHAEPPGLAMPNMPKIRLPVFDGNYAHWATFRDQFVSLIIRNAALSDFARMHYLVSSLQGTALNCISNLPVTADNFRGAWSALKERFDDKQRLIDTHFATLFGLSALTRESAENLQLLRDRVQTTVSLLEQLDRSSEDLWSDFLVYLIKQRLDPATRKAWNLKNSDAESPPRYTELLRFLSARARALDSGPDRVASKPTHSNATSRVHHASAGLSSSPRTSVSPCPLCRARHFLRACPRFLSLSPTARMGIVKKFGRCLNCLSDSHALPACPSQYSCNSCKRRHHSMLHVDTDIPRADAAVAAPSPNLDSPVPRSDTVSVNNAVTSKLLRVPKQILLATARVKLSVTSGHSVSVRALLDQGSEATFISESMAQLLRAKRQRAHINISAVGGIQLGQVRQATTIAVSPLQSDSPSFTVTALILRSLTHYAPRRVTSLSEISHLSDLSWADPDPLSSDPIHVILGADLYGDLILDGVRHGLSGQPVAQRSVFGWLISGPLCAPLAASDPSASLTTHHCMSLAPLEEAIVKFWEVEDLPAARVLTQQEEQCEEHFCTTHSRTSDGRYIVRLPFNVALPLNLGPTRHRAGMQFLQLQRRFDTHPSLRAEYFQFMTEYENLRHMRKVRSSQGASQRVFIPHHPVIRADSATTRLRVVFNASSRSASGLSLNDFLHAGPKLQTELPAILLQWRQFRFVYTADIAKMFRQILIDERDLDYQCILWRGETSASIDEYQLLTVTYGIKCAPYLALRVLRRLAEDDGNRFPLAASILRRQIYVDDVLFGDHDVASLKLKRDQLVSLLKCGQFTLRKWASNSTALLEDIDPLDHGLACDKNLATDGTVKILGIVWNPNSDGFSYRVSLNREVSLTKRSVLSIIARLYDPLGWATPVIIAAKILMQSLWRLQLDWDSPLPPHFVERWHPVYTSFQFLNSVHIPRWTSFGPSSSLELHGFADASTLAYAAAVYARVTLADGETRVILLAGKSKVAPIKPLTVPRLELLAALLLSRLMSFVKSALNLSGVSCFCWSDSTITLSWLKSPPLRGNVFAVNRVSRIRELLPEAVWRHVLTSDNPADCASRGILGSTILSHSLWWRGPAWLLQPPSEWPADLQSRESDFPEVGETVSHLVINQEPPWDLASRFSSWDKLLRVTAYVYRFTSRCLRRSIVDIDSLSNSFALSVPEITHARNYWIRVIQGELFAAELLSLKRKGTVPSKSVLSAYSPFLDSDSVLRVGGRLRHAYLSYESKHPILLAAHPLVRLLARQYHLRSLHGGLQLTLRNLRQQFWILRARCLVKTEIHRCVICVRERSAASTQLMGNLPAERVTPPPRAFSWCGLDYAGPVRVRASAGRGNSIKKAYIAVFICLSTRAVHLELVGDYSTPAFIGAFTRFCSRRGLPQSIYSDNGTNFVGADKELTAAYRAALRDPNFLNQTASDRVAWHFIPPAAPHFGGIWEAGVRSVKHHLRRVVGSHTLSNEEFVTLLCQVEACLNSRPIAPMSDSLEDYQYLTPGHFLIGSPLTVPPEPSLFELKEGRLTRWQLVRQFAERLWRLWSSDYINTLQQRAKWRKPEPSLEVGQLVFLRNPLLPPCKWEIGRVIQVHPGADGPCSCRHCQDCELLVR